MTNKVMELIQNSLSEARSVIEAGGTWSPPVPYPSSPGNSFSSPLGDESRSARKGPGHTHDQLRNERAQRHCSDHDHGYLGCQ